MPRESTNSVLGGQAAAEAELRSEREQEEWEQQLAQLNPVRKAVEAATHPVRLARLSIKKVWYDVNDENLPKAA